MTPAEEEARFIQLWQAGTETAERRTRSAQEL
jgi:hypothetical protein